MEPYRIWSKKIVGIFDFYVMNQSSIFFGVTGDVDNLGILVSEKGRAHAENVVDTINHSIAYSFMAFMENIPNARYVFLPSGEEVVVLGVCKTKENYLKIKEFFDTKVNTEIKSLSPIVLPEYLTVSFGVSMLNDKTLLSKIQSFLESVRKYSTTKKTSAVYLDIMYSIRKILSFELDKKKFKTLKMDALKTPLLYRNFVYAHLNEYKTTTKKTLMLFSETAVGKEMELFLKKLKDKHGLTTKEKNTLMKFIKNEII